MQNTSIHNEKDYRAALSRLEVIFSAKKGTSEGKELDQLADAIVEFEKRHFQI